MINSNQIAILQNMDIDIWVAPDMLVPSFDYGVFLDKADWERSETKTMCLKLLEAMGWPLSACKVTMQLSAGEIEQIKRKGIIFGYENAKIIGGTEQTSPYIHESLGVQYAVLPSLSQMHHSRSDKLQAWQLLKNFKDD